jgi:cytochrome c-type biogenesis protein CcmH/NrfG
VDDALGSLRQRIHDSPGDAEAYHLLSRAYFSLKDWDKAIEAAERAASLKPDSDYQLWLGRIYGEKAGASNFFSAPGWARKSRQAFERAVALDAGNIAARSDLTEFYLEAPGFLGGGKDKARRETGVVEKYDPALAHFLRARLAEKDGDIAAAEREFRAAIEASGNQASYWLNLASFYRRQKRYDDMERAISKAIAAERRNSNVLFDAAEMLLRAGRKLPNAAELLREYLASGTAEEAPAFRAHYLLGIILEKEGMRKEATDQYRAALALASGFDEARKALKRLE